MDQKLFRQQALDQHTSRLYGRVLVLPKISHGLLVVGLVLWLTLALIWLLTATYTQKEILHGQLDYEKNANELMARISVPAKSLGVISEGKLININYDAFPAGVYGKHKGEIVFISSQPKFQQPTTTISETENVDAVYSADIKLDSQTINVVGKTLKLRAGMGFTSEIELGRQSLLNWLFNNSSGEK